MLSTFSFFRMFITKYMLVTLDDIIVCNSTTMIPPVLFGVRKSILGLFLVIGIFGGSYFFIPSFRDSIERFFLNNEDAVLTEELAGKIYMSLTPLDELGEPTYIGIYAYDLITKELEEVLLGSAKREFLTSKISPNGSKVALSVLDSEGSMKLFVSNQNFAEMEEVPIGQPLTIIRNPSWSKDGTKIAFMGKYDDVSDAQDIESWQVYVHDFKTASTSLLTNGTNPVFLPDGGIAVLKKDGLYRITFDDGQGVLVTSIYFGPI